MLRPVVPAYRNEAVLYPLNRYELDAFAIQLAGLEQRNNFGALAEDDGPQN